MREKLSKQGLQPLALCAPEFAALILANQVRYAKVVAAAGIKAD